MTTRPPMETASATRPAAKILMPDSLPGRNEVPSAASSAVADGAALEPGPTRGWLPSSGTRFGANAPTVRCGAGVVAGTGTPTGRTAGPDGLGDRARVASVGFGVREAG